MRISVAGGQSSRGITVLGLLLLILGLVALAFFLVRYLGNRPAGAQPVTLDRPSAPGASAYQPFDQLNLPGVIEIVGGNAVDFLRIAPHALG